MAIARRFVLTNAMGTINNIATNNNSNTSYFHEYLSLWSSSFGVVSDSLPGKQPFWDCAGIQADYPMVENSLSSPIQQAAFLATASQHNGDWFFALPTASCGLWLNNEAARIAAGVRLGL